MKTVLVDWILTLSRRKGSDLYLTYGAPPMLRGDDGIEPLGEELLDDSDLIRVLNDITTADQQAEFAQEQELNTMVELSDFGRFRVNIYRQRQHTALVIRRITTKVPTLDELRLPKMLGELCCEKRGFVLMVGSTGSGKSTSLAAMIDYRNERDYGHILTIEDPVEYVHDHKKCLVSQREVGTDTHSFDRSLKNALRQKPDVILVGEIRDLPVMRHALNISETGHLALATLHANNADQAIERIINFYDMAERRQVLLNLSFNIKAILSQRLVHKKGGGRTVALEILLNQGKVPELIRAGDTKALKAEMAANKAIGMQTFDQHIFELWKAGEIEDYVALAEADNRPVMESWLNDPLCDGAPNA